MSLQPFLIVPSRVLPWWTKNKKKKPPKLINSFVSLINCITITSTVSACNNNADEGKKHHIYFSIYLVICCSYFTMQLAYCMLVSNKNCFSSLRRTLDNNSTQNYLKHSFVWSCLGWEPASDLIDLLLCQSEEVSHFFEHMDISMVWITAAAQSSLGISGRWN